jgi:hypothetical protein
MGISAASLRWWSSQLNRTSSDRTEAAALSPLTFVEMTSAVRSEPIEIVLASGERLRVPQAFDDAALERVLDVLARRR